MLDDGPAEKCEGVNTTRGKLNTSHFGSRVGSASGAAGNYNFCVNQRTGRKDRDAQCVVSFDR